MLILLTLLGLIFFIAGGAGLFYTNVNLASGSQYWVLGNITFGTFTLVGIITLVFMAVFNIESD
jgi:hypothetical protein